MRYRDGLAHLTLDHPAHRIMLDDALTALDQATARLGRLEAAITEQIQASPLGALLGARQCLRGVATGTAATLVAELGDLRRFDSPRQLMADAGLVPGEHSSGGRTRRGSITKTGNRHVRRVVVEAAWHYRHPPRVGMTLRRRQAGQPAAVVEPAWKAQHRRHKRFRRLLGRGKLKQEAVVAVARELLGCLWAIARQVDSSLTSAEPAAPPRSAAAAVAA